MKVATAFILLLVSVFGQSCDDGTTTTKSFVANINPNLQTYSLQVKNPLQGNVVVTQVEGATRGISIDVKGDNFDASFEQNNETGVILVTVTGPNGQSSNANTQSSNANTQSSDSNTSAVSSAASLVSLLVLPLYFVFFDIKNRMLLFVAVLAFMFASYSNAQTECPVTVYVTITGDSDIYPHVKFDKVNSDIQGEWKRSFGRYQKLYSRSSNPAQCASIADEFYDIHIGIGEETVSLSEADPLLPTGRIAGQYGILYGYELQYQSHNVTIFGGLFPFVAPILLSSSGLTCSFSYKCISGQCLQSDDGSNNTPCVDYDETIPTAFCANLTNYYPNSTARAYRCNVRCNSTDLTACGPCSDPQCYPGGYCNLPTPFNYQDCGPLTETDCNAACLCTWCGEQLGSGTCVLANSDDCRNCPVSGVICNASCHGSGAAAILVPFTILLISAMFVLA